MTYAMALPIALWSLFLLLSGCASAPVDYAKPGITQAERQQDMNECVRLAMGTSEGWPLFALFPIDREGYGRCLEARGYTSTSNFSPRLSEPVQAP